MENANPEDSLEVFDSLNLDNPKERRLAVFALNDFYGAIFAEVGKEYLEFWDRDLERGIKHQWKKTKSRFDNIDEVETPDDSDNFIYSVHDIRNNVAHDFKENPPKEILEESREFAPEWADWMIEAAERYREHQESLTATEALVQVGRRTLEYVKDSPQEYSFGLSRQQELLNEDANQLQKRLEDLSDREKVTRDLVNVISDIMELERDKESLESEYSRREEEVRREEQIRQAENTHRFIVTREANEYGEIVLVNHEYGKPDNTRVINIRHPETPEDVQEQLEELEANDEVRLRIEEDVMRDKKGNIQAEPYIAEIR